ncbi:Dual-specificity RNA methyltransferase RlmN [Desulfovibrionales bacterium]
MINLLDLVLPELEAFVVSLGEPVYRGRQLFRWLWHKGVADLAVMTDLGKGLRVALTERAIISWPRIVSEVVSCDGTVKLLLELADGARIETVLIPFDLDESSDRGGMGGEGVMRSWRTHLNGAARTGYVTQCLSTQVGCILGCSFCSTGTMGFTRNLRVGEILGQVLLGRVYLARQTAAGIEPRRLRRLVFMGMGEPLLNLGELLRALEILVHIQGLNFSPRRITVSTVGLPRGLDELGAVARVSLAISLHAPTQELRERIMPRAAFFPLSELMTTLDRYPLKSRQRITYEYLLLKDINDGLAEARQLVKLLEDRKAKVNLITYNQVPGLSYATPSPERVLAFENLLRAKYMTVTLRKSKGADIAAACGQLRVRLSDSESVHRAEAKV